uniref:Uncharacterized protein n=1 Tax=Amphimedon queenslandica TaxID=400682 RepID=A0A1X7VGQ6_AMPQE
GLGRFTDHFQNNDCTDDPV